MNLIWHIFKKDLRRLGPVFVLLAAVLFFKAEFLGIASDAHTRSNLFQEAVYLKNPVALNGVRAIEVIMHIDLGSRMKNLMLWFSCVWDFIFLIMLVFLVLLDDPTLGEKAFWRTRPIEGWQMLAAKAIFILLAVTCPQQLEGFQ